MFSFPEGSPVWTQTVCPVLMDGFLTIFSGNILEGEGQKLLQRSCGGIGYYRRFAAVQRKTNLEGSR